MATITIDIPDQYVTRVVDALCATGHWSAELGVSRNVFARNELLRLLKQRTLDYERRAALAAVPEPPALEM